METSSGNYIPTPRCGEAPRMWRWLDCGARQRAWRSNSGMTSNGRSGRRSGNREPHPGGTVAGACDGASPGAGAPEAPPRAACNTEASRPPAGRRRSACRADRRADRGGSHDARRGGGRAPPSGTARRRVELDRPASLRRRGAVDCDDRPAALRCLERAPEAARRDRRIPNYSLSAG